LRCCLTLYWWLCCCGQPGTSFMAGCGSENPEVASSPRPLSGLCSGDWPFGRRPSPGQLVGSNTRSSVSPHPCGRPILCSHCSPTSRRQPSWLKELFKPISGTRKHRDSSQPRFPRHESFPASCRIAPSSLGQRRQQPPVLTQEAGDAAASVRPPRISSTFVRAAREPSTIPCTSGLFCGTARATNASGKTTPYDTV